MTIIIEENEKDDMVDDDKDGKADASELSGRDFVKRKVILILTKMNPEKVNDAIASIYMGTSTPVSKRPAFLIRSLTYFMIHATTLLLLVCNINSVDIRACRPHYSIRPYHRPRTDHHQVFEEIRRSQPFTDRYQRHPARISGK